MTIDYITENSASIRTENAGGVHRVAYINSSSGRAMLQVEQPLTVSAKILEVWGDGPTIKEPPDSSVPDEDIYIPSEAQSAAAVGRMMLAQMADLDDDSRIRVSGLYEPWTAGTYEVGDIRNAGGQTWECFQAHDNATYPDIKPGSAAWFTFWRPLHGKSPETARPFVPVQGAHDMYRAGEYAVYEGALYKCMQDTAYSPEDYSPAWEAIT